MICRSVETFLAVAIEGRSIEQIMINDGKIRIVECGNVFGPNKEDLTDVYDCSDDCNIHNLLTSINNAGDYG